jgi:hypothetical protein
MAVETPVTTAVATGSPARAARPSVPLRAPSADEAWRVEPAAGALPPTETARLGSVEHLLVEPDGPGRRTLIASVALAVCVVGVVLVGMAIMSHGNGGHSAVEATSAVK